MKSTFRKLVGMAMVAFALGSAPAHSTPAPFTGAYTQNFDSVLSNSSTTMPPGFRSLVIAGANSTYTPANPISTTAIASANAGTQTLIVWNFGSAVTDSGTALYNVGSFGGLTNRALGSDPTGVGAMVIELSLSNNTGSALSGVNFSYACKCLTNGTSGTGTESAELPGYSFFYSLTGSTLAADWTKVNALTNGNYTEGTTSNTGPVTITFANALTNGGVMYFRWADDNCETISPDQMLAIDNISVSAISASGPQASITSPANGATFTPGSNIVITANVIDTNSAITNVEFYAVSSGTTNNLGGVTNGITNIYTLTYSNVSAGSYALTVVAGDASGASVTSSVVNVTVAYTPPTVSITSPANGSSVTSGSPVTLMASTTDTTGTITNLNYFAGSTLVAQATTAPYTAAWTPATGGTYSLTAQVMDTFGLSATSGVVTVTVTNPGLASFTGAYSQNFDLALSNGTTVMPAGFAAMYLPGSHFTYTNGIPIDTNAIVTATTGSGAANLIVWNAGVNAVLDASYQLFNVGCWDSSNDRALGTDPTGTGGTVIQLALANNSGASLSSVNFSYTERCLTNGSTSNGSYTDDGTERLELPGYSFFYSLVGDNNPSNWFFVPALQLTNWVEGTSTDSGPVTLTFPTPLTNGGVMYFRWADDNCVASSPDQMYAIDNISVTGNNGPMVSLTSPTNNQNYVPGNSIILAANASDLGTNLTGVSFYVDGTLAGTATSAPYSFTIPGSYVGSYLPVGGYTTYAVASDAAGLYATSSVVNFTIAYVPPTVSLDTPTNGSSFAAPASIPLSASAASSDGTVSNISLFAGTNLIASGNASPLNYTWSNVPAGSHSLSAQTTDSHGFSATSSVVVVTVTNGFGVPVVILASPTNNASFFPGANITLMANASEAAGTITNVEFYAGSNDLGGVVASPYTLTWSNVSVGSYALTAVASDAAGVMSTSSVVNITVAVYHAPPTVALTSPANNASYTAPASITLSATASTTNGTITNVAFYQGSTLLANDATAPYGYTWTNVAAGSYSLTAVATDNTGVSSTSGVVHVSVTNMSALATLQQIKTVFVIPLENHDFVQSVPTGSPQQLFGNPACPFFNSLITPGNSNAAQTAYATHYYSVNIQGEHPSEPNYVWSEAGTDFGVHTDNDPSSGSGNVFSGVQHLSGQLTAAGISWKDYQEDVQYSSSDTVSASGSGVAVNPYNGTTEYNYAVKHNPMAFFTDTQHTNVYPLSQFFTDLTNNTVGRYNWITPDQYNEMHSSLPSGYAYHGTNYTGDQAAIAEGDNFLSIVIPKIMASAAYKSNGVIIIWTDETESTDDTNTTLPYVIISPLAKGNAYASTLPYSHSSDLKTMDELFGLAYQSNSIPSGETDAQNDGKYNYVNGSSGVINDLSDFFTPPAAPVVTRPGAFSGSLSFVPPGFILSFTNGIGQTYRVLESSNLFTPMSNWTVLTNGTVTTNPVTYLDPATNPVRYYRIAAP